MLLGNHRHPMKQLWLLVPFCLMAGISACQHKGGEVLFVVPDKYQGVVKIWESPDGAKADAHSGVARLVIPPSGRLALKNIEALRSWNKWSAAYENGEKIPVLLGANLNEPDYGFFSLGSWGKADWFFIGTRDEWKRLRETRKFLDEDRKN
jgi:hypothetical protein